MRWINLLDYIIRAYLNSTFFLKIGIKLFAKGKFMIIKSFQER